MFQIYTADEFRRMSPRGKGYIVYWCGANPEQPNIPREWTAPNTYSRAEYVEGQFQAQDTE